MVGRGRVKRFPGAFAPTLLLAVLLAGVTGWAVRAPAAEIRQPSGVVELFTSQGCNSCPPADRVLYELSKEPDVLALAWHVDYWDYLGWKDTFASPAFTKRQRAYAVSLGNAGVYTPQAVVNGRLDVVGSRGLAVREALAKLARLDAGANVPISVTVSDGMLKIGVEATPQATDTVLWMVYYTDRASVEIGHGENAGRKLTYSNIVRDIEMIGMVKDRALQTEFQLMDIGRRGYDSCALILQKTTSEGGPGPIVGAAVITGLRK